MAYHHHPHPPQTCYVLMFAIVLILGMISRHCRRGYLFPKNHSCNRYCVDLMYANYSVQDATVLHLGSILIQVHQFRMHLPFIWAPSSLTMTQFRVILSFILGSILTDHTSAQGASALHLGSTLADNPSSGCFCSHI